MSDPSSVVVLTEESDVNLAVCLVDSDKAGQETAPITGPTSTTPLEGLFQAGFTAASQLVSTAGPVELTESRDAEEEEEDGGDWWLCSVSAPRTTWAHGEGRFFREKLAVSAAAPVGE